jgi:hypothetical protein
MPPSHQTRSQTTIHARYIAIAPLLTRVVTPMTRNLSPPRVPTRSQNLSPRNLSQDDFCGMDTANMDIALGSHHWSHQPQANAVIHPITGKEMEYMARMKDPVSRNPRCAPARTDRKIQAPREPPLKTEPYYYYCPITLVMS